MNGGGGGPENALAPRAQPLIQEQRLPDELMIRLGLKTQQNRQTEEYARSFELFINAGAVPAPPDNTPVLSRAHFIAFATQHWPWGPAQAASSFAACDRDNSGRMNQHEFAVLRRAFITCRPGDEHIPELVQIKSFADERYRKEKLDMLEAGVVLDPHCLVAAVSGGGEQFVSGHVGSGAVNAGLVLDEVLRVPEGCDWRGALAQPRGGRLYSLASGIVESARRMALEVQSEADIPDCEWQRGGAALARLFGNASPADIARQLVQLCGEAEGIFKAQPTVVRVAAPAKILGDIHGQLRDLLLLFGHYGFPSHRGGDIETTAYVFNGDWCDRGHHQLDVVVVLFALKVLYPARIWLVRGNHEFRSQSESQGAVGFKQHVQGRFGSALFDGGASIYEAVHTAFEWLPLGAVVSKAVLVVHGGIGDGSWSVDDLAAVARPIKECHDDGVPPCVYQALWSCLAPLVAPHPLPQSRIAQLPPGSESVSLSPCLCLCVCLSCSHPHTPTHHLLRAGAIRATATKTWLVGCT